MPKKNRVQEVSSLNLEHNNEVAGDLLPLEWKRPDMINLLALAMWGLEEGIKVDRGAAQQQIEDQVQEMASWSPENAQEFIEKTDSGDPAFDLTESQDDLRRCAAMVLGAIRDRLGAS